MTGIEIAALLTSLLAIASFGTLTWQLCESRDQRWLITMLILALPISPMTFYFVRLPVDAFLKGLLGDASGVLTACKLCYAPLTEEPAKLLPLLITLPIFRRQLTNENRVPIALTLGLGFALGEMWLVAQFVASKPEFSQLPFYQFGGYVQERLATCITHSGFVILSVWGIQYGRVRVVLGLFAAVIFHFAGNFPIYLMQINLGNLGQTHWSILISVWLLICVLTSALMLGIMHAGATRLFELITSAKVKCPECGEVYRQPIIGGNFGTWRYEPCGACHKWHWVSLKDIH